MPDVALRFQNLPSRVHRDRALAQVQRMAKGAAAVGFSEAVHLSSRGILKQIRTHRADLLPEHDALPALIANNVAITGRRHECAFPATPVGAWGAGPSTLKPGWDVFLRLDPEGVDPIWWGFGHFPPSLNGPVSNDRERHSRDERRRIHRLEVEQVAEMAARCDRFVFQADWNCRKSYEGLEPLWDAGLTAHVPLLPTHGATGRIDWTVTKGVDVLGHRMLRKGGSDHNGIEVRVR
jgi:hypothetical protein